MAKTVMLRTFKGGVKTIQLRHIIPDATVILLSLYAALYLRVGANEWADHTSRLHQYAPAILIIRVLALYLAGCYSIMWRHVSANDAFRLARSVLVSSSVIILLSFFIGEEYGRLPRSVYIIDSFLVLFGLMGVRLQRRLQWERKGKARVRQGQRTLVYGAGFNGRSLVNRFNYDPQLGIHVIAFVDDDTEKQGMLVSGARVVGTGEDLPQLITQLDISQVIIASTTISGEKIREVVLQTRPFNIKPRIISQTQDKGELEIATAREINLSDLLNRPATAVDVTSLKSMIYGKKVLVTGAGGSIGSEIARQVMSYEPSRLILLDHSEYNLYQIDRELRLSTADTTRVVPLLVDIKEKDTLHSHVKEFSPDIILHAAAYKHVHLVESNPYSSILNNVVGTKNLLEAAEMVGVSNFVLISTDKAVNPAGVMGATKRVCELMVTAMANKTGNQYCSVRFGNVLGSSGSLIPLLREQIFRGGPLTVTHKDMTRYFMTIPEAVSLVLKAATIARPGDINVLKMGDPVKIVDIAKGLLVLMDKTEEEVPIMFTGLRPGEKLYEELYIRGDELKTEHPDILTLPSGDTDLSMVHQNPEELFAEIDKMDHSSQRSDKAAIHLLNTLVNSTYVPPSDVREESEKVSFLIHSKPKVDA